MQICSVLKSHTVAFSLIQSMPKTGMFVCFDTMKYDSTWKSSHQPKVSIVTPFAAHAWTGLGSMLSELTNQYGIKIRSLPV